MKPSDIVLTFPNPLTGTFERAEAEQMAALIVHALAANGDSWRFITWKELGDHVKSFESNPPKWIDNPFFKPDPAALTDRGFANTSSGPGIEFTDEAIARMHELWTKVRS